MIKKQSMLLITFGFNLNKFNFLSNLLRTLTFISSGKIEVLTTVTPNHDLSKEFEQVHFSIISDSLDDKENFCKFYRIISNVKKSLKTGFFLIKSHRKDNYIFFLSQSLLFPVLILKILNRRVILIIGASNREIALSKKTHITRILSIQERINFHLADHIVIYSPCLLKKWSLELFKQKILFAHEHFLDFEKFKVLSPYNNRKYQIGYIGRLSKEKGPHHFVQALPEILSKHKEIQVIIAGDGELKEEIKLFIQKSNLHNQIDFVGWINHNDLPIYLNQIRLLIIPSHTEGLPNVMLEAMACGTVVLATPVGTITDVITSGKTGFIMESNSPDCIRENVLAVMKDPNLEKIAESGRIFVETNFSFTKTVEMWVSVFDQIAKCTKN